MRNESTEFLTASQAAEVAGVTLQTFRVYVASGSVTPQRRDGREQIFSRADAERVGALHRDAAEEARRTAVEGFAAELAAMREALAHQEHWTEAVATLDEAREEQGTRLEALTDEVASLGIELGELKSSAQADLKAVVDAQAKRIAELVKTVESLSSKLGDTTKRLENLGDLATQALHTANMSASVLDEHKRLAQDQAKLTAELRSGQAESQERIRKLVNSLADAFGQARPNADALSPKEASPRVGPPVASTPERAKQEPHAAEPAKASAPAKKTVSETPVATPAKVGIVREIEFNYLLERMGYRRLDAYDSAEIADSDELHVPDDETIKEFLSKYELGCDVEEVEITPVTRGNWQMIQFQRAAKKSGKRAWIGPKR